MEQTLNESPEVETTMPRGRRLREIMDEKGRSCSLRALEARIGISKDTLCDITNDVRWASPDELRRIGKGVGVEVARIKQEDTREATKELEKLLKVKKNPKRALELAKFVFAKAIGLTERCDSLNLLGRAYFLLGMYEECHEAFTEAYRLSKKISEKYKENERLYKAVKNLLISSTVSKDYYNIAKLLDEVETKFVGSPEHLGEICYARAIVSDKSGNTEGSRINYYQSLEFYRLQGDPLYIGRAEHNIGSFEFRVGNYVVSEQFFFSALQKLQDRQFERLVCKKEYCKTLIKLGKKQDAIRMINEALEELQTVGDPQLEAKFKLLLARATADPEAARSIVHDELVKKSLRNLAAKFLVDHYDRLGDYENMSKYYQITKILSHEKMDILMEEEL